MNESLMTWQPTVAIVIFLILYAIWLTDQLNRAVIAIVGAVLFLLLGIVQWQHALTLHINWNTLLLWTGMMVIAGVMNRSGWIQVIIQRLVVLSGGRPAALFILLMMTTALGAALLDAVTMILLIIPLILRITRSYRIKPAPFLIGTILVANLGATATMIGSSANIWIGTNNPHLRFLDFLMVLGPVVLILFIVYLAVIGLLYYKTLRWQPVLTFRSDESLLEKNELVDEKDQNIVNKSMQVTILIAFILIIAALIFSSTLAWQAGIIAAVGAALLLILGIIAGLQPLSVVRGLEWDALLFFAGLFILAGGLVGTGWITAGATSLIELTDGNMTLIALLLLWVTALLSMAMDHMPWIAVMIPLVQQMGEQMDANAPGLLNPLWWSLALGAGLGGAGTLFGSAAGILTVSIAQQNGQRLGYWQFLRVALPLTLWALVMASFYIMYILIGN